MSTHDHIATGYIDIVKTSRPGSDESEEDGLCIWRTSDIIAYLLYILQEIFHVFYFLRLLWYIALVFFLLWLFDIKA